MDLKEKAITTDICSWHPGNMRLVGCFLQENSIDLEIHVQFSVVFITVKQCNIAAVTPCNCNNRRIYCVSPPNYSSLDIGFLIKMKVFKSCFVVCSSCGVTDLFILQNETEEP